MRHVILKMPRMTIHNEVEQLNLFDSCRAYVDAREYGTAPANQQLIRLVLLDALAPYCEHDLPYHEKSAQAQHCQIVWQVVMKDCADWEVGQGY